MNRWVAFLGTACWAIWLMGMDPEQEPIDIEPPRPLQKQKNKEKSQVAPEPVPEDLAEPESIRLPFLLNGPFRLQLELPVFEGPRPERNPEGEPGEAERVHRRLGQMLVDLRARERVLSGQVPAGLARLGAAAEERFKPELSHIRNPDLTRPNMSWFGGQIRQRLRDAPNSVGCTYGDPLSVDAMLDPDRWLPREAADTRSADPLLTRPRESRVSALIELQYDLDGRPSARVHTSSGFKLYDEAALKALVSALPLQKSVDGSAPVSSALFAASSDIHIKSVLPVGGLGLELVLPLLDPVVPATVDLSSRLDLISVEVEPPEK